MRTSILTSLAIIAAPLVLLTACDPAPPTPTASSSAPSAEPSPSETMAPVFDEDVLLVVTTTATADNGAELDLTMTVRRATAWSDAAAADRPALMTAGCEGALDASVYEANLWSFLAVEVTATADAATPAWPADKRIRLWPTFNDDVSLASEGFLVEDADVNGATPHCRRDRFIYGAGEGRLVAGIQGDTDEATAAGNYTRWANQLYGFVAQGAAGQTAAEAGIELSGCDFHVTEAGIELNGNADWWDTWTDEGNCYIGSTES